jgi:hypothetical protein
MDAPPEFETLLAIFNYEVEMYREVGRILQKKSELDTIHNALVESHLLHIRILAEIFNKCPNNSHPDDITLQDLLPLDSRSATLKNNLDKFKKAYGKQNEINSPCWHINKHLAHPTKQRSDSHDYSQAIGKIKPLLDNILQEIEASIKNNSKNASSK